MRHQHRLRLAREHDRAQPALSQRARDGAETEKAKLEQLTLKITKAAGENDKLFGSVTNMELEALLRHEGFTIERRRILLGENIKALGDYEIDVRLHRDVTATLKVSVTKREEDEASA